jgi:hypothetical protein
MRVTMRGVNGIVAASAVTAIVIITNAVISARGTRGAREAAPEAFSARPPLRLSETGLFVEGTVQIDARNRPYSPQYPLWSDGAGKSRWVRLPEGSTIDVSNVDAWEFPIGTKFWKEFAFNGRKVETRFLWKASEREWVFATYVWNEAQTDATLAPDDGVPGAVEVAPGARHTIPSIADCRACHDSARTEILGFNALQLSDDRDPNAPHAETLRPGMVTLRTLIEEGVARPARTEWIASPPRIPGDAPTRAALGYLSANCGHCHNPEGSLASIGLFLKHSSLARTWQEEPAAASAVAHASGWQIPGAPDGASLRVSPGDPDLSAILRRMRSRSAASQMPPLGTGMTDQEGIETIERWIKNVKSPR